MGIISEVKCGRCDRRYSGLRARCPYCGARRGRRGKHAKDNDNSKGRLIIGLILLVVLIVAVVVVVATNVTELQEGALNENQQTEQGGNIADSDGVTNLEGVGAEDETGDVEGEGEDTDTENEPTEEDTSGVSTAVSNLYITNSWSSDPQGDFTANVGDVIQFGYVSEPEFEDAEVLWETSDDNVFVILQTGEFTAIGAGSATLSLTVNDKTVELFVIVND